MIDFHTHILPGMDDGSRSPEETGEMLRLMQEQGVDVAVATPHFDMRRETIEGFLERRRQSAALIPEDFRAVQIVLGAEVFYCGVELHQIEQIENLCIGQTRFMLIETFVTEWREQFKTELLALLATRNITPVIAHIERYCNNVKNMKMIRELKSKGAVLQMNAGCFIRRSTRKSALRLLKDESVDILGSDCHRVSVRTPNLDRAISAIRQYAGDETVDRLNRNAQAILGMEG